MLFVVFVVFWIILVQAIKTKRKKKAIRSSYSKEMYRPSATFTAYQKEQDRKRKEAEKEAVRIAKEKRAEFEVNQAVLDVEFYISRLDDLYTEYHSIQEDLDILGGKIDIAEDMHGVDKLKRLYKQRDKIKKNMQTVLERIHNTEKKLRSAQYKAGIEITC